MGRLKNSLQADALANLYRSAFYLGLGEVEVALSFLEKSFDQIEKKKLQNLEKIVSHPSLLASKKQQLFWAEKILDLYREERDKMVEEKI